MMIHDTTPQRLEQLHNRITRLEVHATKQSRTIVYLKGFMLLAFALLFVALTRSPF